MLPIAIAEFFAEHQDILWMLTVTVDLSLTLLMYRLFGKTGLYGVIVLNIMLSNIQGPKLTMIFGLETSLGLILYAGIYFATDLLSEKYGQREASRAVMLGFATSIIVVIIMSVNLMFIPSADKEVALRTHEALVSLFNFTPWFVFGSLFVYLVSQNLDVWIFHYIKDKTQGRHLWLRNNVSTMVSQLVDTVLYTLIVWWPLFLQNEEDLTAWEALQLAGALAVAKYFFKVLIALIDTPFIYIAREWNVSHRDWHEYSQHELEAAEEAKQDPQETPEAETASTQPMPISDSQAPATEAQPNSKSDTSHLQPKIS